MVAATRVEKINDTELEVMSFARQSIEAQRAVIRPSFERLAIPNSLVDRFDAVGRTVDRLRAVPAKVFCGELQIGID